MSMGIVDGGRRDAEPRFELVLEQGGSAPRTQPVCRGEAIQVGRAPDCAVTIDDDAISRRHVTLRVDIDAVDVEDTSTNGTLADGVVLRRTARRIGLGRPVAIGGAVITVRRLEDVAPPREDARESGITPKPELTVLPPPGAASEPAPEVAEESSGAPIELRREVHRLLLEHLDMNAIDPARGDDPSLRPRVLAALRRIARMLETRLPEGISVDMLVGEVADEALGLGPLERLLADPAVSEIMVIDAHHIYVEQGGKLTLSSARFTDEERVRAAIERIVTPLGRRVDESSPLVDARLADGSRVNVVIRPLALRGSCITIRKFARTPITLANLLDFGALSQAMATFLTRSVQAKKNVVIAGGTGSGKTTLLNVLSAAIPEHERIVTIEDAAELQLRQPHVVSLESRPANMEGKGEVAIRELVKNALRMRPDRIVVGECRGGEALDMLQAMNTGHDGSLTTTHANSPAEALMRLETLSLMAGIALPPRAIREQLAKSIHLLVQQTRLSDGSRRVTAITELAGLDIDGSLMLRPLYEFVRSGTGADGRVEGAFEPTGYLPSFLPELLVRGLIKPGEAFL
ncbi:MAG: ATPase, T2SS/T4P/T4SS family [Polyangiales bacterium]